MTRNNLPQNAKGETLYPVATAILENAILQVTNYLPARLIEAEEADNYQLSEAIEVKIEQGKAILRKLERKNGRMYATGSILGKLKELALARETVRRERAVYR